MSDDQRSQAAVTALQHQLPKGIAVDLDAFFPRLTGWGVERKNRKRIERLTKVAPVLAGALEPDETVQFITHGTVNLWWELLFLGVMGRHDQRDDPRLYQPASPAHPYPSGQAQVLHQPSPTRCVEISSPPRGGQWPTLLGK